MVVTDYNEQFLDKQGTDHLIDELQAYVDGIVGLISSKSFTNNSPLSNNVFIKLGIILRGIPDKIFKQLQENIQLNNKNDLSKQDTGNGLKQSESANDNREVDNIKQLSNRGKID